MLEAIIDDGVVSERGFPIRHRRWVNVITSDRNRFVVIPKGMTPIFLRDAETRLLAYVEWWTPAGEFKTTYFDLYPLDRATKFILPFKVNDVSEDQTWYSAFGGYTKEAFEGPEGLKIRDRV